MCFSKGHLFSPSHSLSLFPSLPPSVTHSSRSHTTAPVLALAGGGLPLRSCNKIIDLRPGAAAQFLVVGCIYKEQVLKPSILDEYSGEEYCRRRISCCAVCLKP